MSRSRILHLFNDFQVGGVERQHMMLVRELAAYYEQACWSYGPGPIQGELDALGILHQVGPFCAAAEMLDNGSYDCIVLRTNRYMREMGDFFSTCDVPVVYIRSFLRWFEGNKTYFDAELETISYTLANYVFFSGPSLQTAAQSLNMKIPGNQLLYNGLEMDRFPIKPRTISTGEPLRVGMLANLAPHKNQHTAIDVLQTMLRTDRCSIVLGGACHYPEYGEKVQAAAKGIPVTLKGYVSDPVAFHKDNHVMLLSSTHEGWPIAIMEAMACGLPVIAADLGDTRILLDHGKAGLLYPAEAYDQIPELVSKLSDPKTYAHYSKAGVEHVRNFDIRSTAEKLRRAIETVRKRSFS